MSEDREDENNTVVCSVLVVEFSSDAEVAVTIFSN